MKEVREITIERIIEGYSVLLLDSFGVIAGDRSAYPGAVELIGRLNRTGKPYYILTNDASSLPENRSRRYQQFGLEIPPEKIITSGILLDSYFQKHRLQGSRCIVLGPQDSERYIEQAGGVIVPPTAPFDAIVIGDQSGFPFVETVDTVLTALFRKLDSQEDVHLILPNPDLIYAEADGFGIASASVALIFEAALELRYPDRQDLRFVRLGKPFPAIFQEALRRTGTRNMVMIGDQLETDIRGANDFGIDSVLVGTGINTSEMSSIPENLRPKYAMRSLVS